MNKLPFFNWSLKKTLTHISDPLDRAKIQVFFFVLLLNYPKIIVGLTDHLISGNAEMIRSDAISFVITTIVLKLLLSRSLILERLIHVALIATTYYVIKSLFFYKADIPVMQQIFMAITFSFYGLGRKWGIFYTSIMIIGIVSSILLIHNSASYIVVSTQYSDTRYAVMVIILNFLAIAIAHYHFHAALYHSLTEGEILNTKLQSAVKEKSDFLSTMSHELRTPLNSVIGMANILVNNNPEKEEKDNLDILKFSAETLLSLINNILDFNKIDSGKIVLESIPFNLDNLMRNTASGFGKMAADKGLAFHLHIDPAIALFRVIGDPTRLLQIMFNLGGNAIKFTKTGSVSLNITILEENKDAMLIRFSVKDTGVGIHPDDLKVIFEPFLQASESVTRNFGGTGLGLSIVKYLLQMKDSNIMVESIPKEGTHFYFDINYPITSLQIPESEDTSETQLVDISTLRILLAEDNPMNIFFMKKLFRNWNLPVTIAENGEEAVRLIEEQEFDLVLMDLNMPVMDGYEAIQLIRKMKDPTKSNLNIIALTASTSDEVMDNLQKYEVNGFLSKPFHPDELKSKLQSIVTNQALEA